MSTVKTVKYQVGTDGTSTNNFTIYQPDPPDGTMRIGVGNADSPTEIAQFTSSGLNASALTGTLPAIDGSSLTNLPEPDALSTASGSAPSYSARAWVNFTGTGTVTINGSGNVSSITDNTTGDYTINFTTAMPDVNYNVTTGYSVNPGVGQKNTFAIDIESQTTTTCQLYTISGGSATDTSRVFVAIFR
jgi:hypothetical protein